MWQQWVNGALAVWMIILSFINISAGSARSWLFWLGIVIAILAFWGAATNYRQKR